MLYRVGSKNESWLLKYIRLWCFSLRIEKNIYKVSLDFEDEERIKDPILIN